MDNWNDAVVADRLEKMLAEVKRSGKCLLALKERQSSPYSVNTLLDTTMRQMESACVKMRRLCEEVRPAYTRRRQKTSAFHEELYGEIERMETGWLHICLNSLLPHYKVVGSTEYIADSLTRLIDRFVENGGDLPFFPKAYLAIVEECDFNVCEAYDQDNKGFRGVLNALKGRVFADDNQFELSLGLFTEWSCRSVCNIYVTPMEEIAAFHEYRYPDYMR